MLPPKNLRIVWVIVAIFVTIFLVSHVYMGEDQPYTLEKVDLWHPSTDRPQHQVLKDAHQLRTADAFLPHFKAVIELPGYTIQAARRTCPLKHGEKVNFQWEEGGRKGWISQDVPNSEIEFRRREWQSFVGSGMIPYSKVKKKFSGRGLVVVAGNQDTLTKVEVILRSLVRLRSKISVELHYWDSEVSEVDKKGLLSLYSKVHFNDLAGAQNIVHVKKDGKYINYQLKTAALVNSRFSEPILLDSDNIPVIDPALLYSSATYREFGTIFWPDIARTRPQNPAWAIFNTRKQ
jgi:alpha 1,2-mannosyltransferase